MADGRNTTTTSPTTPLWREIFRCFQIAIDPRKLLVAAAGIITMSAVWYLLSLLFYNLSTRPDRNADLYSNQRIQQELGDRTKPGTNEPYREEDLKRIGDERFQADLARWLVLEELAGPGGRLRTMPWYEFRGENPFSFLTRLLNSSPATWGGQIAQYTQTVLPVLLEPLAKLLLPVARLASPGVSPLTRLYLILVLVSSILIWAFFAGVITRIAAMQYTRKGPVSLKQAVLFVYRRYLGYAGGPLLPLGLIAFAVLGLIVYGLLGLIPLIGDVVIYGLGLPLILLAGIVMAFFAVGLIAYPLMFVTLSVEGDQSDALDAVSRSMNYLYQTPWRYMGYWAVALVYGAAVTFFVLFFVSLAVYLGKWAVSQAAAGLWSSRNPAYLFIYAPESFGWRELLTADSPYAIRLQEQTIEASQRVVFNYVPVNESTYKEAMASFYGYNTLGAGLVGLWLTAVFLLMVGFSYSFFWSASTIIYFLLRKVNDEAELDEIYEEEQEEPFATSKPQTPSGAAETIPLPVTTSSQPPAEAVSSAPTSATGPSFTGLAGGASVSSSPTAVESPPSTSVTTPPPTETTPMSSPPSNIESGTSGSVSGLHSTTSPSVATSSVPVNPATDGGTEASVPSSSAPPTAGGHPSGATPASPTDSDTPTHPAVTSPPTSGSMIVPPSGDHTPARDNGSTGATPPSSTSGREDKPAGEAQP